jgi:arabinan endo-1,5-alpha-L-arabinosidase
MRKRLTRREFVRSSLLLGAGLGISRVGLARMQNDSPSPEATPSGTIELTGKIKRIHDPVIIKAEDAYYVFCTGAGIPVRKSLDMLEWDTPFPAKVFANIPEWAREMIPGQQDIWAPDISYFNGKYQLYYSVSTFGKNRSVIGLATNVTLDSESDDFEWVDEGLVLESVSTNDYNCIDPNFIVDADGVPWLAFGSFWTGIKMRRLDAETRKPSTEDETLYSLARRFVNYGAVEAPFIIRKGDFYYLFASFDSCCRGADSDYHVMVGRSEAVTGPYVDKTGTEMMKGGGTQVTFPTERWRGPGHNAILQTEDVDYIVYHSYDADNAGVPTLRMDALTWDADGWPSIVGQSSS